MLRIFSKILNVWFVLVSWVGDWDYKLLLVSSCQHSFWVLFTGRHRSIIPSVEPFYTWKRSAKKYLWRQQCMQCPSYTCIYSVLIKIITNAYSIVIVSVLEVSLDLASCALPFHLQSPFIYQLSNSLKIIQDYLAITVSFP